MTGRRPHKARTWLAAAAAASLILGTAGAATTAAQAKPKPAPAPAAASEPPLPAPAATSLMRVKLSRSLLDALRRDGAVLVGTGQTQVRPGGTVEIPVEGVFRDGVAVAGGFAITVKGKTTFICPDISIALPANALYCGKDGTAKRTLNLGQPAKVTKVGRDTTRANIPLRISDAKRAAQMNAGLRSKPFTAGTVMGEMDLVTRALLRGYPKDPRSGCDIGDWAGDNSIWRGWAVQALVNRFPRDVGMSGYSYSDGKGTLVPVTAPAVAVGQRTPYKEKINTMDAKRIIRGSWYDTDNFWDGPSYGCNTNAPFIVGQGLLDAADVKAWRYDGGLRTTRNNPAGAAKPQWWGHARQTNYDGPTGSYSWTCRGLPANQTSTDRQPDGDSWWSFARQGSGFVGDGRDQSSPNGGRAPECADANLDGFNLTTRYSISKRGGLEARNDQGTYPRSCSVDNSSLVGCWQEIYPLWDRAWAFQYHVYAAAMRANISSNTTIKIPASWTGTVEMTKPLAWRLTDGAISGAWPKHRDAQGNVIDYSAISTRASNQDWTTPSPFTVPGTNAPFTVSGYGTPMGPQSMTVTLTADTDGSWTWPVHPKTGQELPRPQIQLNFGYVISNYDNGRSCQEKVWYDDASFSGGRNNDSSGPHCIEGQVPTLWPLPANADDAWKKRAPDSRDKDGKVIEPNVSFTSTSLFSCLNANEIKVQNVPSALPVPNVGADHTWTVRVAGQVSSFSGC
jgi:hypothetical protein